MPSGYLSEVIKCKNFRVNISEKIRIIRYFSSFLAGKTLLHRIPSLWVKEHMVKQFIWRDQKTITVNLFTWKCDREANEQVLTYIHIFAISFWYLKLVSDYFCILMEMELHNEWPVKQSIDKLTHWWTFEIGLFTNMINLSNSKSKIEYKVELKPISFSTSTFILSFISQKPKD